MNDINKIDAAFKKCRDSVFNEKTGEILLSKIAGSDQEADLSVPANCEGLGRIHHFRRNVDNWVQDPLPNDPACKALGLSYTDMLEVQVFQLASCNVHCWYCFVPDNLKCGKMNHSRWLTADKMVDLYANSNTGIRVIDLSGGNPELVPEWSVNTIKALEHKNLLDKTYLWTDDTLTTDFAFEYLSKEDWKLLSNHQHFGKVGCFKGFDNYSFSFNSKLPEKMFDKQFERFARYIDLGIDIFAYATFTSDNYDGIEDKIGVFMDRLQRIHPILPLRTVPLKIFVFTPTGARLSARYVHAIENQELAINAWKKELEKRFSPEQVTCRISDHIY